jgi:hypothetical protein
MAPHGAAWRYMVQKTHEQDNQVHSSVSAQRSSGALSMRSKVISRNAGFLPLHSQDWDGAPSGY